MIRNTVRAGLIGLVLLLGVEPAAAALTVDQQRCQSQVAKQGASHFHTVARALRRCRDKITTGTFVPGLDCTIESTTATKTLAPVLRSQAERRQFPWFEGETASGK